MGWWSEWVVPRLADRTLSTEPVRKLRVDACEGLSGRVLEIGFGSGLNAPHYPSTVESVDAVEPSDVAWRLAADRVAGSAVPIRRTGLDGQRLDAPTASYDCVLSTFTLCTIPDIGAALGEVRRVLRPGGSFHFLEHGLSPDPQVATWQRRFNPVQRRLAGGCHLDRPIDSLVADAGLEVDRLSTDYLPGPRVTHVFGHVYLGTSHV
jgi:ubiquinone/menaquinone biosynthesis C-methylase UbiE